MSRPIRRPTPAPARRKDKRFVYELPVLLRIGRATEEVTTLDVGHGGAFVQTSSNVSLRQLIRVEAFVPPGHVAFESPAKLVHRVGAGTVARAPGLGIQFYGIGRPARAIWDAFIDHIRPHAQEAPFIANLCHASVVVPLHRRKPSEVATLRISAERLPDLVAFLKRAVFEKSSFVLIETNAYIGDEVRLQVVHPHNDDVFEIAGKITRVVRDGPVRGLELELSDLDAERALRFEEFVYDALAPMFDDEEIEEPTSE